jgi:uncharacterized Zn finger protein
MSNSQFRTNPAECQDCGDKESVDEYAGESGESLLLCPDCATLRGFDA